MSDSAQLNSQLFYYADGKKIPLAPSDRFIAVRSTAERGRGSRTVSSIADSLSTTAAPTQVFELPQYDLTVIKVAPGRAGAATPSAATVRSLVDSEPELALVPSVYEVAETPTAEGLIAVGEILVKFQPNVTEAEKQQFLTENHLEIRQSNYPEPGSYLVATASSQETVAIANKLHESDLVQYAQPNFVRLMPRLAGTNGIGTLLLPTKAPTNGTASKQPSAPAPTAPPTDPGFASQWGLVKIQAPEAWDISMGRPEIAIAIIDEGCDLVHEDLSYRLPGYDAVNRTDDPSPLPADGHGTSCAGIAAATANNGLGGAGVAPNCQVLPVRIAYGQGGGWVTSDAIIADGIRTAVIRGADVLSNSWGGGAPSSAITSAFQFAQTDGRGGRGCPIAAATGNWDGRGVSYPANLSPTIPGFLAVGASNEWDQRKSQTSSDGETWWGSTYGPEVDVVAPGVHIYTTDISGSAGYGGGNYIPNFNGTSSATPHVAGLMGLILSIDPELRSWEVEDIIKLSAQDLGTPGRDEEFGFGRINCRRALDMLSPISFEINVTPEFIGAGKECFMRINLRMFNPSLNTVRLDSLAVISHNDDWSAEVDRFESIGNPGSVMAPLTGQDVQFNNILLKANGTEAGWSYRWSLGWSYTFWRPNAPVMPFAAHAAHTSLSESAGVKANSKLAKGSAQQPAAESRPILTDNGFHPELNGEAGDSITVDRQSKSITIVIR